MDGEPILHGSAIHWRLEHLECRGLVPLMPGMEDLVSRPGIKDLEFKGLEPQAMPGLDHHHQHHRTCSKPGVHQESPQPAYTVAQLNTQNGSVQERRTVRSPASIVVLEAIWYVIAQRNLTSSSSMQTMTSSGVL